MTRPQTHLGALEDFRVEVVAIGQELVKSDHWEWATKRTLYDGDAHLIDRVESVLGSVGTFERMQLESVLRDLHSIHQMHGDLLRHDVIENRRHREIAGGVA